MGAFNTLVVEQNCSSCNENVMIKIQFKYGDTWQYEYTIGEKLRWGGNDIGDREATKVVVAGISEGCPNCSFEDEFEIFIEDNIIKSLRKFSGEYDFTQYNEEFILIEKANNE